MVVRVEILLGIMYRHDYCFFSADVHLRNIILKSDKTLVEMVLTPHKHIIALQQVTHVCN